MRSVFKLNLHGSGKILTMTTWTVAVLRYKGGVLKGRKEEVIIIDWKQGYYRSDKRGTMWQVSGR